MLNPELKIIFEVKANETSIIEQKVIHNKNSRKNKIKLSKEEYEETLIKWCLFKYVQPLNDNLFNTEFFPLTPSEVLNNGLSANFIANYLNSNLVFDFYQPKENDKLTIRMEYKLSEINRKSRPYIGDFISLIFTKEWKINKNFNHIHNSYSEVKHGNLTIIKNKLP
ncbi:hypothetical protein [uncultured Kordia sp.]|uniref:hypothetical protein n=1 Tax=uncultured Kordia sp. TaxID=507699 RepID=UPI00261DC1CD|nr:hypothetical protein [uncultured Kordia sp.]